MTIYLSRFYVPYVLDNNSYTNSHSIVSKYDKFLELVLENNNLDVTRDLVITS